MRGTNDTYKAILSYICTINNSMTDMGKTLSLTAALLLASTANAQDIIVHDNLIKSLKVEVNDDWSLPPVLTMDSDDVMTVSFDRLGHDYCDMNYRITHCNWDWTPSDMSEIDYLDGFNGNGLCRFPVFSL